MTRAKTVYYSIIFFGLVLLAFSLRILALNALADTPYYTFLLPDEKYYHDWALDILHGKKTIGVFEYAPLPAYFMALIYKIFSIDIHHIRNANIIINVLGCLFVYLTTKMLTGRNWALLALAFSACSAELIFYSIVPLKTSLSFFLFALLIYLVLLFMRSLSGWVVFAAGLVLGLAMTVRPNVVVFLPVIIVVILYFDRYSFSRVRKVLVSFTLVFGFFCTSLVFPLHNYISTGKFALLPIQSGFLFYCTNTTNNPTPFYRPVAFASSHPDEQGVQFVIEASKRQGKIMTAKQASRYWQRQVVKEGIEKPDLLLQKLWLKALMLFNFTENSDHYNLGVVGEIAPFFELLQLKFWLFMLIGYAGLVFGIRRSLDIRCLLVLLLAYHLTLLLYSTGNRFFLPVLAILIPSSVWLIQHLFQSIRLQQYAKVVVIASFLMLLIYIGQISVYGTGDLSKHYNNLAFIYKEQKDIDSAIGYWRKSSQRKETYSDIASLFLAGYDYQQSGPQPAVKRLQSIADNSFMSSAKYLTLGDIYKHHNRYRDALDFYQKSLLINYGQIRVREEIIAILAQHEPDKIPAEIKLLKWVKSFYPETE